MIVPSKQRASPHSGSKDRSFGVGYVVACLAPYALVMAGVRFYAKEIGVVGGLLTIVAMYIAARCYERRQYSREKVATANSQAAEDDSAASLSTVPNEHDPPVAHQPPPLENVAPTRNRRCGPTYR